MSFSRKRFENKRNEKMSRKMSGYSSLWGGYYYDTRKQRYVKYEGSKNGLKKYVKTLFNKRIRRRSKLKMAQNLKNDEDIILTPNPKKEEDMWGWD